MTQYMEFNSLICVGVQTDDEEETVQTDDEEEETVYHKSCRGINKRGIDIALRT